MQIEKVIPLLARTEMPAGGHFGEWEEPQLLADDIRVFFAAVTGPRPV